ncbi:hypothetical protein JCM33374_g2701 [Metschnikowia sp. JCM 33374]|nr:hypothetical protein JCM33374_g2701 [Metschnikowia sp. JCM 33374]
MAQTNPIASRLLRSQRYIIFGIVGIFVVLMLITAAAGRGYVDKDSAASPLSNTYSSIWGGSGEYDPSQGGNDGDSNLFNSGLEASYEDENEDGNEDETFGDYKFS